MRRERSEEMEIMLLAARPREIEREIEYADGFQIIQETVSRDNWGKWYWEIFMCDEWGIMKIIRATTRRSGEVDDIKAIYLTISDVESAAEKARMVSEAARVARLSA